jgi:hypothetical protein
VASSHANYDGMLAAIAPIARDLSAHS